MMNSAKKLRVALVALSVIAAACGGGGSATDGGAGGGGGTSGTGGGEGGGTGGGAGGGTGGGGGGGDDAGAGGGAGGGGGTATAPIAPSSLGATNLVQRSVRIFWGDASDNETGFEIERALGGAAFVPRTTVGPNVVSFDDGQGLLDGTHYNYRVRAVNGNGASIWRQVGITTEPPLPVAPSNITVAKIASGSVRLTWQDNSDDETSFILLRANGGTNVYVPSGSVGPNETAGTVAGLTNGTAYRFSVRALSAGGTSDAVGVDFTLPSLNQIGGYPPTNVKAVQTTASNIRITWEDNSGETAFQLERSVNDAGFVSLASTPRDAGEYDDGTVTGTNSYGYRVQGYNSQLMIATGFSAEARPVPTLAPEQLAATPVSNSTSTIQLSWVDNAFNETSFTVEQRQGAGAWQPATPATAAANATSLVVTGLSPDTEYSFRIRATNAVSPTLWSAVATASTNAAAPPPPALTLPEAPTNLTAQAISSSVIQLSWTDNSDNESSFNFWHSEDGVTFSDYGSTENGNTMTAEDQNLGEGTKHYYRVRAKNDAGYSAFSNLASASTRSTQAPAAPSNLTAVAVSETTARISFTDNATSAAGFDIQASGDGTQWSVDFGGLNATTITITNLTAGMNYYFRVRAFNYGANNVKQYSGFSNVSPVITTPSTAQTLMRIVNNGSYPIISLVIDNGPERFPNTNTGIPVGNPGPYYDVPVAAGNHTYRVVVGFWDGPDRFEMYRFSGTTGTIASGTMGTVTISQPNIGGLLRLRAPGGYYLGTVFENGGVGSRGICFDANGLATRSYANGVATNVSAQAVYTSYPKPGEFSVGFRIGSGAAIAQFDELRGYFYYRNGPTDWPLVQYYPQNTACP